MERVILHCDCDNYFASVESIFKPELKLVPMAVCGDPEGRRGIVLAKNQLAKAYGVVTAEPIWQAKQKCPQLVLVSPQHNEYTKYSQKVNEIYQQYTNQVEPFSIDESWLDVTGSLHLFGSGKNIADELRQRIREELGITISVGVSFNKSLAKLASDMNKPDGTTQLTRENFKSILYPKPVETLLFVGKNAGKTLREKGITTIGDIERVGEGALIALLGKGGSGVYAQATGQENEPVRCFWDREEIKSVGNGTTFAQDLVGYEQMRAGILTLCDTVGSRLRKYGLKGSTVALQIKNPQFQVISRQMPLPRATQSTKEIYLAAVALLEKSWKPQAPVRLFTVTVTNLVKQGEETEQLSFFHQEKKQNEKQEKLEQAMDTLRGRYGKKALIFGSLLEEKEGEKLEEEGDE